MWFDPQVEALLPFLLMQVLEAKGKRRGQLDITSGHVFIQGPHNKVKLLKLLPESSNKYYTVEDAGWKLLTHTQLHYARVTAVQQRKITFNR
jgi:hypothetical protein